MDPQTMGIIGLLALVVLITFGVPLAFGIGFVGIVGNAVLLGFNQAGTQLYQSLFQTSTEFALSAIPLFVFMGALISSGNLGKDLYGAVQRWFGFVPGGLAVTTVISCAGLGAVTGVSAAGIGALGPVALPEMRRAGYADGLSAGSLASASTLAILIPPSISFIVYGIWTDTSIGKLFMAGVIPGIVLTAMFCLYIVVAASFNPAVAPRGPSFSWRERMMVLPAVAPILVIFLGLLAGLYLGWFTPTEGAAVGCAIVASVLWPMGRLKWANVRSAAMFSGQITIMIFVVVMAVQSFSKFLVLTDVPKLVVDAAAGSGLPPAMIMALILLMYLFLGMILDSMGMMILSLPFVFPVVTHLGFDPVWFGVVLTVMIEIGLLTPPVGLNCYMLHQIAPYMRQADIFRGVFPFVLLAIASVGLFSLFPQIVLWLPSRL